MEEEGVNGTNRDNEGVVMVAEGKVGDNTS